MGVRWLQFSLGACAVGFLSCAFCLVSIFGDLRLFLRDSQHELTQFKEISDHIWDSFLKDAPEIFASPTKSRTIRQATYVQSSYVNGAQTTRAPYGAPSIRPTKPPGCNCQNEKNNCPAGPPGPKGQRGHPGPDALPGAAGIPGIPAFIYRPPADPYAPPQPCISCPAGAAGPQGPDGYPGEPGPDGFPGMSGMPGLPGIPGMPGAAGNKGYPGQSGLPGKEGMPGASAIRKISLPGPPGARGSIGRIGYPGEDGMPGLDGRVGPVGPPGYAGQPGRRGIPGGPGTVGGPGEPGHDAAYCPCPPRSMNQYVQSYQNEANVYETPIQGYSQPSPPLQAQYADPPVEGNPHVARAPQLRAPVRILARPVGVPGQRTTVREPLNNQRPGAPQAPGFGPKPPGIPLPTSQSLDPYFGRRVSRHYGRRKFRLYAE